jgi:cytochrome c-type biogenesis protein CcmH/NrfG
MDSKSQSSNWTVKQAAIIATCCFVLGVAIGFMAHGPNAAPKPAPVPVAESMPSMPPAAAQEAMAPPISTDTPSPEQLKAAGKKATMPLMEQLQKNPKDFKLLVQVGEMYYHHGAFADAGSFYKRALDVKDSVPVRNQYASTFYFQGDADAALQQYDRVLKQDAKNEVALFNSGMVHYKLKKDPKGAIQLWQTLLKDYPNHPHRAQVQSLIDQASKQNI